jgi:hypothetical protein
MSRPLGSQSPWQGTGRYGAHKRDYTGKESLVFKPTRRSIQVITGIVLFFLVFTFVRHQHQTDLVSLDGSALGHNRGSSTGSKYAIVTFETRDVTYWKESLANKFNYVQRHGYPLNSSCTVWSDGANSYELIPTFEKSPLWDIAGVWAKIPLVLQAFNMGEFEWVMWMDFDTLFMNMSCRMEDFMEDVRRNHVDAHKTGQKWEDVSIIASPDW